jgi:DNA-binding CsgD family transcriptional regulator
VVRLETSTLPSASALALSASASGAGTPATVRFDLDDNDLLKALRLHLIVRTDVAETGQDPAVIVADHPIPEAHAPVLVVGSDRRPGPGESVIRSLDPAVVLSAAALVAAGHRIEPNGPMLDGDTASRLSAREKQVAELLVEGASNKLIARRLGISVHTAKFHVAAVLEKLGARNRADAVAIVMREGLVVV